MRGKQKGVVFENQKVNLMSAYSFASCMRYEASVNPMCFSGV